MYLKNNKLFILIIIIIVVFIFLLNKNENLDILPEPQLSAPQLSAPQLSAPQLSAPSLLPTFNSTTMSNETLDCTKNPTHNLCTFQDKAICTSKQCPILHLFNDNKCTKTCTIDNKIITKSRLDNPIINGGTINSATINDSDFRNITTDGLRTSKLNVTDNVRISGEVDSNIREIFTLLVNNNNKEDNLYIDVSGRSQILLKNNDSLIQIGDQFLNRDKLQFLDDLFNKNKK